MGGKCGSPEKDSGILFKGKKKKTTRLFAKYIYCAVASAAFRVCSLQVFGTSHFLGLMVDSFFCSTSGDTLEMLIYLLMTKSE